MGTWK